MNSWSSLFHTTTPSKRILSEYILYCAAECTRQYNNKYLISGRAVSFSISPALTLCAIFFWIFSLTEKKQIEHLWWFHLSASLLIVCSGQWVLLYRKNLDFLFDSVQDNCVEDKWRERERRRKKTHKMRTDKFVSAAEWSIRVIKIVPCLIRFAHLDGTFSFIAHGQTNLMVRASKLSGRVRGYVR